MSTDLLARYYQKNKERLKKKLVKGVQIFSRRKKQKVRIWLGMILKILLSMRNKG